MKGLEISKAFFEEYGRPMLMEQFPELMPYLAAGLCGSGSECLGYDDDVSTDHDYEPGFIIFLPGEDVVDRQTAFKDGKSIALTHTEFQILQLLATHRKKIFSLEHIYQSIWNDNAVGDDTIMVHIKNLRKKLGDNSRSPIYIKTAWGKGYYID